MSKIEERPQARAGEPVTAARLHRLRGTRYAAAMLVSALPMIVIVTGGGAAVARPAWSRAPTIEPQVCSSCQPPLTYAGGPVLAANRAGGLTVTPIFWAPSGGYTFPAGYERIERRST